MPIAKTSPKPFLGTQIPNTKVLSSKIDEIITELNAISNTSNGITNLIAPNQFIANKNVIKTLTPFTAATDTTVGWTLANVKIALLAGAFKTTSVAAVTLTLDSVANIITSFATVGVTLSTGSLIEFIIDNSQGANTVTLAVDSGTTIAVPTPAITGGNTLTVSTANKLARFQLYLTSTTTATLSRLV